MQSIVTIPTLFYDSVIDEVMKWIKREAEAQVSDWVELEKEKITLLLLGFTHSCWCPHRKQ